MNWKFCPVLLESFSVQNLFSWNRHGPNNSIWFNCDRKAPCQRKSKQQATEKRRLTSLTAELIFLSRIYFEQKQTNEKHSWNKKAALWTQARQGSTLNFCLQTGAQDPPKLWAGPASPRPAWRKGISKPPDRSKILSRGEVGPAQLWVSTTSLGHHERSFPNVKPPSKCQCVRQARPDRRSKPHLQATRECNIHTIDLVTFDEDLSQDQNKLRLDSTSNNTTTPSNVTQLAVPLTYTICSVLAC